MHTLPKRLFIFAVSLSALAGYVDAVGFIHLGGYFISFMSGNSTRLAINIVEGGGAPVVLLATILFLFVMGTMTGMLVRHFARPQKATVCVLSFVTALLGAAAIAQALNHTMPAVVFMVLAMGAENAILLRNGEVMGLTYMTGTLAKIGQSLAQALTGGPRFAWLPYLLLWSGLLCGGIAGTILFFHLGLRSLWLAAAWAALLTLTAMRIGPAKII